MLTENIVYAILTWSLGFLGLLMFFRLKHEGKLKSKLNGALIKLSKVEGKLNKSNVIPVENTDTPVNVPGAQDYANMTLEEAAEMFGFSAEDLNNPLVRPFAEKLFNRWKAGEFTNAGSGGGGGY